MTKFIESAAPVTSFCFVFFCGTIHATGTWMRQEYLQGHRDREDRIIEPIEETNWGFQLDNELPKRIQGQIFIPKGVWHRAIKGSGDLKIKLKKL